MVIMKRLLLLLAVLILPLPTIARDYLCDLNRDGKVDVSDAVILSQIILADSIPDEYSLDNVTTLEYSNPVFIYDWPDPTVWQGDDGLYYSYSTAGTQASYTNGLGKFLYSADMVQWEMIDDYVIDEATRTQLAKIGQNFWAPQVIRIKDQWLMYLTVRSSATTSAIVVLSFDSPTFPAADGSHGPWKYRNCLTQTKTNKINDNIDPCVTVDHETGKVWLFFGSTGKDYRVELSDDGLELAKDAQYTHVAGLALTSGTNREKVFEGSYLYYRAPYWYYFVSSGQYDSYNYQLKVGRSEHLTGVFLDREGRPMTEGYATTLLSTPDSKGYFWGPGHCGEIFTGAFGQTYMFYHSHSKATDKTERRSLMLQRIHWDKDGWPYFHMAGPQQLERLR